MVARARRTDTERISDDPGIAAGKPVVKGTRIPVELVLNYLANNPNLDDLFVDYPRLTVDDVKACLAFAGALVETNGKAAARRRRASATVAGV